MVNIVQEAAMLPAAKALFVGLLTVSAHHLAFVHCTRKLLVPAGT
jgi:hypothetical protein